MSTYFHLVCDVCKRLCGVTSSVGGGSPLGIDAERVHPFIARHVYCLQSLQARRPGEDFASAVRVVDEHSWEREQAVTKQNGWLLARDESGEGDS